MALQQSAAPPREKEGKRVVTDVPKSPAYVPFQPVDQTGTAASSNTSPLLWLGAAFLAYQVLKKK